MTDLLNETAERADAQVSALLDEIEREAVPERLLDLAVRLQNALHDRHLHAESAEQGA